MGSIAKSMLWLACTSSLLAGCASDKPAYSRVDQRNTSAGTEVAQPEAKVDQAQEMLQAEIARREAQAYAAAVQAEREAANVKSDPGGIRQVGALTSLPQLWMGSRISSNW